MNNQNLGKINLNNVYLGTLLDAQSDSKEVIIFERKTNTIGMLNKKKYTQYKEIGTTLNYYIDDNGNTIAADHNYNIHRENAKLRVSKLVPLKEAINHLLQNKNPDFKYVDLEQTLMFCNTFQKYVELIEKQSAELLVDESILSSCFEVLERIYSYAYFQGDDKQVARINNQERDNYRKALNQQRMTREVNEKRSKLRVIK